MSDASSDDEARSLLYLLHFSEPCPQCFLARFEALRGVSQVAFASSGTRMPRDAPRWCAPSARRPSGGPC